VVGDDQGVTGVAGQELKVVGQQGHHRVSCREGGSRSGRQVCR
jgi:hypothetical protein